MAQKYWNTFVSRGADCTEFVPKAFADERMTFGDVVGVRNGVASKTSLGRAASSLFRKHRWFWGMP